MKLPAECLQLLGASAETRMLLLKPAYGSLMRHNDGSQRQFAVCASLGFASAALIHACSSPMRRISHSLHLLSPLMDYLEKIDYMAAFVHMDDMPGSGNIQSAAWQRITTELKPGRIHCDAGAGPRPHHHQGLVLRH